MFDVRITVMKVASYPDLIERYELPQGLPCLMKEGMSFVSKAAKMPEGFCENAWPSLSPFVEELAQGGGHFYGEWMKDPSKAMISCNDGFRPVSFLLERV